MSSAHCNSLIFLRSFIHSGKTFIYFKNSRSLNYHFFLNVWKASYTISASIIVDVPYQPPYSTDKFISCVLPGPSKWFFHFGEEILIVWANTVDIRETPISSRAWSPWQQRCDSLHCLEEWWGSVRPSVVVFSWVHAITIFSPKLKNHCESRYHIRKISVLKISG